ncbi:hypothetical protein [Coxiella-like endosymbiont]|uniref:hypothetical protein n=1 Tax=Coxiella-like endosymbiont TaxID=1592897 RepID=UPI00272D2458|nr:hypothetical protein [Coxiella-like endosymbiont]
MKRSFLNQDEADLCFGDSLTWGFNPETRQRFSYHERWTELLQKNLRKGYQIIAEGLNGRTTVYDEMFTPYQRYGVGVTALPMILDFQALPSISLF